MKFRLHFLTIFVLATIILNGLHTVCLCSVAPAPGILTYSSNANGSITSSVTSGSSVDGIVYFAIKPNQGCYLSSLTLNGFEIISQVKADDLSKNQLLYKHSMTGNNNIVATFSLVTAWAGNSTVPFTDTLDVSYLIYTPAEMAWLAGRVNGGATLEGRSVKLMNDLDLGGVYNASTQTWSGRNWTPVGNSETHIFRGFFDGNNHVITNIYVNPNTPVDYAGLFGHVSTNSFTNIGVANGYIAGRRFVGLIAYAKDLNITKCFNGVEMRVLNAPGDETFAGGICGYADNSDVSYCMNYGKISTSSNSQYSNIGGIFGILTGVYGTIGYCYNIGEIQKTDRDAKTIGAIVGAVPTTPTGCEILYCYYDRQMCPIDTAVGHVGASTIIKNNVSRLSTNALTQGSSIFGISANWIVTASLYPKLASFTNHHAMIVAASPAFLSNNENISTVNSNFTVGISNIDLWNANPTTVIMISGSNANVTPRPFDVSTTLTVTKENYFKTIFLNTPGTCEIPQNLTVTSANTPAQISISWTGNYTDYIVEWKSNFETTFNSATVSGKAYTITNLASLTRYEIRVRTKCSNIPDDISAPSKSVFATTVCGIFSVPYLYDFNTVTSLKSLCLDSLYWDTKIIANSGINGTAALRMLSSYYTPNSILILPQFDIKIDTIRIRFKANGTGNAKFEIGYMTEPANYWTFQTLRTSPVITARYPDFQEIDVSLSNAPAGSKHRMAIRYTEESQDAKNAFIDELYITAIPQCYNPVNIVASNIEAYSAIISWDAIQAGIEGWRLEYKLSTALNWGVPVFISSSNGPSIPLSGLQPNSEYEVRMVTNCKLSDTSEYSSILTFKTPCAPETIPWQYGFEDGGDGGSIGCMDQVIEAKTGNNTPVWRYNSSHVLSNWPPRSGDYNAIMALPGTVWLCRKFDLAQGNYRVKMYARQYSASRNNANITVKLIHDTTSNGRNTGITIISQTSLGNGAYDLLSGSFTVDAAGVYYLAIRGYVGGNPNSVVIDDLEFVSLDGCVSPEDVFVAGITGTTAKIAYSKSPNAIGYKVGYKTVAASDYTYLYTTDTVAFINGLFPSTDYIAVVAVICGIGDTSFLSPEITFTTLCPAVEAKWNYGFEDLDAGTNTQRDFKCIQNVIDPGHTTNIGTWRVNSAREPNLTPRTGTLNAIIGQVSHAWLFRNFKSEGEYYRFTLYGRTDNNNSVAFFNVKVGEGPTVEAMNRGKTVIPSTYPNSTASNNNYQRIRGIAYVPAGEYVIGILGSNGSGGSGAALIMDDLQLEALVGCVEPIDPHFISVESNAIRYSYTGFYGNPVKNYIIAYKKDSDTQYTYINTTDTVYTITPLLENTAYSIKVAKVCTSGDTTIYSDELNFITPCAPATPPWIYGFEEPTIQDGSSNLFCMSQALVAGTNNWRYNTSQANYGRAPRTGATNLVIRGATPSSEAWFFKNALLSAGDYILSGYFRRGSEDNNTTYRDSIEMRIGIANTVEGMRQGTPILSATVLQETAGYQYMYGYFRITTSGEYILGFRGRTQNRNYISVDDIALDLITTCVPPINLKMTNIGTNSATCSFDGSFGTTGNGYKVAYKKESESLYTFMYVTQSPVVLQNLAPGTTYQIKIAKYCGIGDTTNYSPTLTFDTKCAPLDVPYFQNFDNLFRNFPNCWTKLGGGTVALFQGFGINWSNCLEFTEGSTGSPVVLIDAFKHRIDSLRVSFEISSNNSATITFKVGVLKNPNNPDSFVEIASTGACRVTALDYEKFIFDLYNYDPSMNADKIAIQFHANGGSSPGYLDNLSVELSPSCIEPYTSTVSNITQNSARIAWTAPRGEQIFNLKYRHIGASNYDTLFRVSSNPNYLLSGLTPNTEYEYNIQTICSNEDSSRWNSNPTFRTDCGITPLPYFENFNSARTETLPQCYAKMASAGSEVRLNRWRGIESTPCVELRLGGNEYYAQCVLVLPEMNGDVNNLRFRFEARAADSLDAKIYVGFITDLNNINSFVVLDSTGFLGNGNFEEFDFILDKYTGSINSLQRLALRSLSVNRWIYIDDIKVSYIPDCFEPTNVQVRNILSTKATVSWNTKSGEKEWIIEYKPTDEDVLWTKIPVSVNPFVLENLEPNTSYQVRVIAKCDTSESEASKIRQFRTPCAAISTPWICDFEEGVLDKSTDIHCMIGYPEILGSAWRGNSSETSEGRAPRSGQFNAILPTNQSAWLFKLLYLPAGFYEFKMYARQDNNASPLTFINVSIGTDANAFAMQAGMVIVPTTMIGSGNYQELKGVFEITVTGEYYLGVKGTASLSTNFISIDDISVKASSKGFILKSIAGTNGFVTPQGSMQVSAGASQTYTFIPNPEYQVGYLYDNSKAVFNSIGKSSYTLSNISEDHTINVLFELEGTVHYFITSTSGANGTIYDLGEKEVSRGTNVTYAIVPAPSYRVKTLKVDNTDQQPTTIWEFRNINANHTIHAEFEYAPCQAPTGLNQTAASLNSVRLEWNPTDAEFYQVHYKILSASNEYSQVTSNNFIELFDLASNVTYEWRVRAVCQSDSSVFSESAQFFTTSIHENELSTVWIYVKDGQIQIVNPQNIPITQIEVLDVTGRVVYASAGTVTSTISLHYAASGIYIVRLQTLNAIKNYKILMGQK